MISVNVPQKKTALRRAALAVAGVAMMSLSGCVATVSAPLPGVVYTSYAPPAPYQEVITVAPGPSHVWVGGYYTWTGRNYTWNRGYWTVPPRGYRTWAPGYWSPSPRGHHWVPGRWR